MNGPVPANQPTTPEPPRTPAAVSAMFPALPQPRHWLLLGAMLCATVVALALTVQLMPGATAAELQVDRDLSQHHVAVLTAVAMVINVLFGPVAGLGLVAAIITALWLVRRDLARAAAFCLVACSGWLASEVFKLIIARQRPNPALLFDPLAPETGSNSFPSGHVSFAVALAFAVYFLSRRTRWSRPVAAAGAAMAVIVAWSRVYIGVHYPTDVIASFLATSAAVVLLAGLWNRFGPRLLDRLPSALSALASRH